MHRARQAIILSLSKDGCAATATTTCKWPRGAIPTVGNLDAAAPSHPVWLEHRSGHASALNSRALQLAGIHRETPDPPGGVIERDPVTGEPTGTLFEMRSFLRQRLGNTRSPQEFENGMRAAGQLLNSYGITSVQDAGADNGIDRWRAFRQLQSDGALSCRITMFVGVERLNELSAIPSPFGGGLGWGRPAFGSGDRWLRLGHAKIMLTLTSGALHPSAPELAALVADAHHQGFQWPFIASRKRPSQPPRKSWLRTGIRHSLTGWSTAPKVHAAS